MNVKKFWSKLSDLDKLVIFVAVVLVVWSLMSRPTIPPHPEVCYQTVNGLVCALT